MGVTKRGAKAPAPSSGKKKLKKANSGGGKKKEGDDGDGDDESNSGAGDRPTWAVKATTVNPKCASVTCKPVPDKTCQVVNVYDNTVPKPVGGNTMCCETYKCFNPDGSFYPFHGKLYIHPV